MQMRSAEKDLYPNYLDISCGGHLSAGETVQDGARELEEELGLKVDFEDLIFVGNRVGINLYKGLIDHEISHTFLYQCDKSLNEFEYQREEISGLIALPIEEGIQLFAGEIDLIEVEAVGMGDDRVIITRDQFIPSIDNIYYKSLILAKRFLAGEKHLLI